MTRSTTRHRVRLFAPLLAAAVLLVGCGDGVGTEGPTDDFTASASEALSDAASEAMAEPEVSASAGGSEAVTEQETMSEPDGMAESEGPTGSEAPTESEPAPAQVLDITATTADGTSLALADYAGQPVFVETFATWCSNCRRQLGDTQAAAVQAGDDAVFLVLSVESDLDPARLDDYAAENGFSDLTFAVLSDQSLATLADQFGNSVLVPPSTPKFTVDADGSVSELTTGYESVEEILGQLDTAA